MRTVIYVGLLAIADSINKNWHNHKHIGVYATILLIAMAMDIVDFIFSKKK
jgi:hypothetical protein